MQIAIVGAGPGGLFASVALADTGHDVTVFEQSDGEADVGAGIQLSPNGTRLLARHGLLDVLNDTAFEPHNAALYDARTKKIVFRTPLGNTARNRYGAPYLHLHRADLTQALHKVATSRGVKIRTATHVEKFENTPDTITVQLANNSIESFDLLIGADGIHSTVRNQLFGEEDAQFTGHVAWRGLVPSNRIPKDLIAPDATVWAGPDQHFVHYFVRGGTMVNFVAIKRREHWVEENWRTKGDINEVRDAFSGWSPGVAHLLENTDECHLWGLFDRPPLPSWIGERVALLGDACHPMLPFMAQGAVMAFEDAAVLSLALSSTSDVQSALNRYEVIRKPRTTKVQERARRNGILFHQQSLLKRTLTLTPLAIVNRLTPDLIARQLDWIYGHDAFAVDA